MLSTRDLESLGSTFSRPRKSNFIALEGWFSLRGPPRGDSRAGIRDPEEEMRVDTDGEPYTHSQFEDFYGDDAEEK